MVHGICPIAAVCTVIKCEKIGQLWGSEPVTPKRYDHENSTKKIHLLGVSFSGQTEFDCPKIFSLCSSVHTRRVPKIDTFVLFLGRSNPLEEKFQILALITLIKFAETGIRQLYPLSVKCSMPLLN